ncbi:hypothetical protein M433DRAFT_156952 [Acidomyces richmondensis BFW]|nr:hypothetical protein M433DRAFT_156952 [Acidomyces richmondensis BFW]
MLAQIVWLLGQEARQGYVTFGLLRSSVASPQRSKTPSGAVTSVYRGKFIIKVSAWAFRHIRLLADT